jgi:hypothetical protein
MKNIITRNANTINANRFLVGKALDAFRTLVTEHNGEIGIGSNGFYKATFEDKETATRIASTLNAQYAEHGVRMPEPKKAKTESYDSARDYEDLMDGYDRAKASPRKGKGKVTLNDFIKANPLCTREEAKAHGFEGTRAELKALKTKLGVR